MDYDGIFGEEIYGEGNRYIEQDIEDLADIFERKGFDTQLTSLILASCEFMGLSTLYKEDENKERNYYKLIQSMAILHTLIETFIASDDSVYDIVEEVRRNYIESELKKNDINNRIAYLYKNKNMGNRSE
ncbi:hypothetical protein NE686_18075 [Tissierella carlieri]|uniref:Uncharacterized protein n=1 Tax=Tissierella carlieri TaxID=689904 RepID=A0ABT1SEV6_9FIRM|nr:hypothetical protein [Tissierella carlieri]MCQ4925014.1 hypothetical protein [Tissierella carlieri]